MESLSEILISLNYDRSIRSNSLNELIVGPASQFHLALVEETSLAVFQTILERSHVFHSLSSSQCPIPIEFSPHKATSVKFNCLWNL